MRIVALGMAVLGLASMAAFVGCKKSSTNPYGGGGGGGGGSGTLNLSLPNGGAANFTFANAGRFAYKCGIHPSIMHGDTVIVDAASLVTDVNVAVVGVSTPGFNPSTVTIKPGGTVHWTNGSGMAHSVIDN